MNDQQKINKEILLKLLKAVSQEEVTDLIENHLFFKKCGWRFNRGAELNNTNSLSRGGNGFFFPFPEKFALPCENKAGLSLV